MKEKKFKVFFLNSFFSKRKPKAKQNKLSNELGLSVLRIFSFFFDPVLGSLLDTSGCLFFKRLVCVRAVLLSNTGRAGESCSVCQKNKVRNRVDRNSYKLPI